MLNLLRKNKKRFPWLAPAIGFYAGSVVVIFAHTFLFWPEPSVLLWWVFVVESAGMLVLSGWCSPVLPPPPPWLRSPDGQWSMVNENQRRLSVDVDPLLLHSFSLSSVREATSTADLLQLSVESQQALNAAAEVQVKVEVKPKTQAIGVVRMKK